MKIAKWLMCCAVSVVFLVGSMAEAQFGGGQSVAQEAERSSEAEQSVSTAGAPAAESARDFCQCVGESDSAAVAKITQALRNPLGSGGLKFTDTPLEQVVKTLEEEYGIPVELDTSALEEIGIDSTEPVTASLHGISLNAALRLMLHSLQLTYVVQHEVLLITTPEEAEAQLVVCVYDVRSIASRTDDRSIKQLIDTIVSCVHTDTWAVNGGGEAEIRPLGSGLLVVSQTQAVHDDVRAMLATVRDLRERSSAKSGEAGKSTAVVPDADRVVTRAYVMKLGDASNPEALRQQIRTLITSSIPNERWQGQLDDGQHVLLTVLPDRIVLRHKPEIQKDVETLLTDSGVATAVPRIASEPGPGGYGSYGAEYGGYGEMSGGYGGYGGARGGYGRMGGGYGGPVGRPGGDDGGEEVPQPEPVDSD
jgi:hypothetical protein